MTEAEWLVCTELDPMLEFVRGKTSDRKLMLYTVAACRRIWCFISDARLRNAVEILERYAEGTVTSKEVSDSSLAVHEVPPSPLFVLMADPFSSLKATEYARCAAITAAPVGGNDMIFIAATVARNASRAALFLSGELDHNKLLNESELKWAAEQCTQAGLLRDIFGPLPFRQLHFQVPVPMRVVRLAKDIYNERPMPQGTLDTARLSMLADALLECGCGDAEVQAHCRSEGPHVRGCWAVDLILEQRGRRLGGRRTRRMS
jgi:hypothetical protein